LNWITIFEHKEGYLVYYKVLHYHKVLQHTET